MTCDHGRILRDPRVRLLYASRMRELGHADAGSRWYRLHGTGDPVITDTLLRVRSERIRDFEIEKVDGVGHWAQWSQG